MAQFEDYLKKNNYIEENMQSSVGEIRGPPTLIFFLAASKLLCYMSCHAVETSIFIE